MLRKLTRISYKKASRYSVPTQPLSLSLPSLIHHAPHRHPLPRRRQAAPGLHAGQTCHWGMSSPSSRSPSSHILHQYDPLVQPALLRHEITPTEASRLTIASARYNSARVLAGQDERVLVIVGPCSIHSPEQAIDYAKLLKAKIPTWSNLLIVMRAYL